MRRFVPLPLLDDLAATPTLGQRLEPEHVANLPSPSDPRISPDGERLVWVQRIPRDPDADRGPYATMLWLGDADGGDAIPYTSREGRASRPRWSPSGDRIAFLDRRPHDDSKAKTQIHVIPIGGGEAEAVTESPESISDYA